MTHTLQFNYRHYPVDGCKPPSGCSTRSTAAFANRTDAARNAALIRRQCGYAVSARLNVRYWFVQLHRLTCRCGNCPVLQNDGTIRGTSEV
jgi:hypothetical protein